MSDDSHLSLSEALASISEEDRVLVRRTYHRSKLAEEMLDKMRQDIRYHDFSPAFQTKCEYCQTVSDDRQCQRCGAPKREVKRETLSACY